MHDGHRDRLRKRFLEEGLDNFEEHEIIEFILYGSIPRRDTNTIAHNLLERYGSLANVLEADPYDLIKVDNIGMVSAVQLAMIPQLSSRYIRSTIGELTILNTQKGMGEYCVSLFHGASYERFYVVALDIKKRVLHYDLIDEGTLDQSVVFPRRVVEILLRRKAYYAIIAHNHPSGVLVPSQADMSLTKHIYTVLRYIDIELLDHIIVSRNKYISFAEKGLL